MTPAERLIKDFRAEKELRRTWEAVWEEVAGYVLPSRAGFNTEYTAGTSRRRKVYDTTAEEANEVLAAGLSGMLTNKAQRWFLLRPSDPDLAQSRAVKLWMSDVMDRMYAVLNHPQSRFYSEIDEAYLDYSAFGTCFVMSLETDKAPHMVYQSRPLSELFFRENANGQIDTKFREINWPLHKIVDRWGVNALPDDLRRTWEDPKKVSEKNTPHRIVHAILPRRDPNYDAFDAGSKPWASVWILEAQAHVLLESGFDSDPAHIGRFRVRTGEKYGVGPGVRNLPDIRLLNAMIQTVIKAAQKVVDPPLQAPDQGFIGPIRTVPGGLNWYRPGTQDRIEPISTGGRPDIGLDMLERQREKIRAGFYNDAFDITNDSSGVNVKATFTMARRDDKLRKLAPVFSRFVTEFLEPAVVRLYESMDRRGLLPEAPRELENARLIIDYVSPISRAQRTPEAEDILRTLELAAPLGELNPEVWDNFDGDAIVRLAGNQLFNVPPEVLRDAKDVQRLRDEREQQQQIAALAEQGKSVASGLRDVASAQKDFAAA